MIFRDPKNIPILLLVIGLGICWFNYHELQTIQQYTDEEIEASVELNYAFELVRIGREPKDIAPEDEKAVKDGMRKEIYADTTGRYLKVERDLHIGIVIAVFGGLVTGLLRFLEWRDKGANAGMKA